MLCWGNGRSFYTMFLVVRRSSGSPMRLKGNMADIESPQCGTGWVRIDSCCLEVGVESGLDDRSPAIGSMGSVKLRS